MDALTMYARLVRGNEFVSDDLQYLYEMFVTSWKVRIHSVVLKVLKQTENQDSDARQYFYATFIFEMVHELENFSNYDEREIYWGLYIGKIAETLSTDLQVEIIYKVSL